MNVATCSATRSAGATRPLRSAAAPGLDVDVEEDFGVIADEADRDDQEPPRAARGALADQLAQVGADPRLRRPPGALVRAIDIG